MPKAETYESPLVTRNASPEMCGLFSQDHRARVWRRLWIALAEGQKKVGLKVTNRQIAEMKKAVDRINHAAVARYEKRSRHDVMAHLLAFADLAPSAKPILHLGATSAYVVDNADLIIMRDGLDFVRNRLANLIDALGRFARKHRSLPTLGYTHFQPAQLTTVGKRAVLWAYDFVTDLAELERLRGELKLRGLKGATGTQASFLSLVEGDASKVDAIERHVARTFGFSACEPVTGQTYSRKIDARIVSSLAQVAVSVHKFANDVRLLSNLEEVEEPFERDQIGSSAMAYKRNPMRCERATGLARFLIGLTQPVLQTAAEQWLERTLDDSAIRRLTLPESFLAADGMLRVVTNVARGLVVHPKVIAARVAAELPFMATEEILMAAVQAGGDRQELHERIRRHAVAAASAIKESGSENDLLDRLAGDAHFDGLDWNVLTDGRRFVGRAPEQVDEFLRQYVQPVRRRYRAALGMDCELNV